MRIDDEVKLDYSDVLIRPKRSTLKSRQEVDLVREYPMMHTNRVWTGVPIVAANMDTIGTFEMAAALAEHKLLTALHKHYPAADLVEYFQTLDENIRPYVFYSLGIADADREKLDQVLAALALEHRPTQFCIDVANGYSQQFAEFVSRFRESQPDAIIMAGNVVTGEMVEELVLRGADIVKVGIGPGSVCTTRKQTGVGYPQVSAVIECADAAHGLKGLVCADGGCTEPGDVAKAFGAGADFAMLGGMLAGHDECGGRLLYEGLSADEQALVESSAPSDPKVIALLEGRERRMEFYGMSSETAMNRHSGGVSSYRAAEGKTVQVPYRGSVHDTVLTILGGVRSTCTYVGAVKLKELSKRTTFIRVNKQRNLVFGQD